MDNNPELPNPAENPSGDREHLEGRPYSLSTYNNLGCRCDGCRAFAAQASRRWRENNPGAAYLNRRTARERLRGADIPEGLEHTYYTYDVYACRCDDCRASNAEKNRAYYHRKKAGGA